MAENMDMPTIAALFGTPFLIAGATLLRRALRMPLGQIANHASQPHQPVASGVTQSESIVTSKSPSSKAASPKNSSPKTASPKNAASSSEKATESVNSSKQMASRISTSSKRISAQGSEEINAAPAKPANTRRTRSFDDDVVICEPIAETPQSSKPKTRKTGADHAEPLSETKSATKTRTALASEVIPTPKSAASYDNVPATELLQRRGRKSAAVIAEEPSIKGKSQPMDTDAMPKASTAAPAASKASPPPAAPAERICPFLHRSVQGLTEAKHRTLLQSSSTVTAKTLANVLSNTRPGMSKEDLIELYLQDVHGAAPAPAAAEASRKRTSPPSESNSKPADLPPPAPEPKRTKRAVKATPAAAATTGDEAMADVEEVAVPAAAGGAKRPRKAAAAPACPVSPGDVIELERCRFEVGPRMAAGADSTIFEGTCTSGRLAGRAVVVKVQAREKKTVYQITTEYTTLAALGKSAGPADGLHVQRALAYGAHGDGCYVLVSDRLGPSLLAQLPAGAGGGRMSARNVLLLARQGVPLLQALHRAGFVHRDIKPENLVMGPADGPAGAGAGGRDQLHLIDFGTAEPLHDRHGKRRATAQAVEGTVTYMAVSTHDRRPLAPRDDLEAFGWTLLRLYTGPLPWEGRPAAEAVKQKRRVLADGVAAAVQGWGAVGAEHMAGFFDAFLAAAAEGEGEGDYEELEAAVAAAWQKGTPKREFGALPAAEKVVYKW